MQTFHCTPFYNDYRDHDSNHDNWRSSRRNDYNRDNYQSNSDDKPDLQKQLSDFIKVQQLINSFVKDNFIDLKTKLETTTKNHQASIQNLEAKFDRFADKQSGRPSGSLPKEDFDALLDEGSKILYSIEGTILEEKLFAEFDEFMAMTTDEKSESKSDTEEPSFKKITFNTDYKIKTSLEEPPTDLALKPLPDNLEYAFLEEPSFFGSKVNISDRGTHFCNKIMEKNMKRYGVNHRFSISYQPQTSGQVENTNRALKRILEKTVKDNHAIWSRKLNDAMWAFQTAYKTPTGTTPYKLVYGKNSHLPFKIEHHAYWALQNYNPDFIVTCEKRMFQLHELDEFRHQAYETLVYTKQEPKFGTTENSK
ncbi:reverse transcriptase domain-containing protein [Tanacetum coccineum]